MSKYRTEHLMKAHIQIVGWNHYHYIGTCILSCQKQTVPVPIVYVDNDSKDESVAYVKKNYPDVRIIENKENRGYAGGHNDGIKAISDSGVVICLNPDVVLEKDFVEKILQKFEQGEIASAAPLAASQRQRIGAVVPLLFRDKQRDKEGKMRIVVDSYGTRLRKNLNVENIMEGEFWEETNGGKIPPALAPSRTSTGCSRGIRRATLSREETTPWGFTGAAVAFSRSAIDDLKDEKGNFFDEDLHSYREDVDTSWRLNQRGWKVIGAPDVRAWHARAARKGEKKAAQIVRLSWRNYFLVIIKDVPVSLMQKNWFPFGVQVLARVGQLVVTPQLWVGLPDFLALISLFLDKRRRALQ